MFLRVDTDLFININNVLGYKLFDEGEAYKLIIWCNGGNISHTVFYLKDQPAQISLLKEIVNNFREITINPDLSMFREVAELPEESPEITEPVEEPKRRVIERLPRQMTIDDYSEDEEEII